LKSLWGAMSDLGQAFIIALRLIWTLDPELIGIVTLSLRVSLSATAIAFVIGAPVGALLAVTRFPGRNAAIVLANALLGLPPVVVGLIVYLLLSRSGPLGQFGLLFTPTAMIIAQAFLALPIVIALVHRTTDSLWSRYGDAFAIDGASRLRTIRELLLMGRSGLLTASLAAFGRAIAEVGAIIIVGGNIRGSTRTMTTAIALETSKGDLPLALGLGLVLILLSVLVTAAAFSLDRWAGVPGH
jgi:tungstate transport system permease protein